MLRTKIKEDNTRVLMNNTDEEIEVGINKNAISFIIDRLTDMYSKKGSSIVRELISNAIDTTKKVKNKRPIEVTLPDLFNNEFIVKDYGEGMSREDLVNIYTQYGASNKLNDLDTIGAFGLGAKVPFCYTNTFFIETTKNGRTIKGVLLRTKEKFSLKIISDEKSNLPNGTTINVPINDIEIKKEIQDTCEDYIQFKESITVDINFINLEYNKKEEIIHLGDIEIEKEKFPIFIKGDDTNLIKNLRQNYYKINYLVEGYPYRENKNYYASILYISILPGCVDFISSRENLDMTEKTTTFKKMIQDKINKNIEEIIKDFIEKEENFLRKNLFIQDFYSDTDKIEKIKELVDKLPEDFEYLMSLGTNLYTSGGIFTLSTLNSNSFKSDNKKIDILYSLYDFSYKVKQNYIFLEKNINKTLLKNVIRYLRTEIGNSFFLILTDNKEEWKDIIEENYTLDLEEVKKLYQIKKENVKQEKTIFKLYNNELKEITLEDLKDKDKFFVAYEKFLTRIENSSIKNTISNNIDEKTFILAVKDKTEIKKIPKFFKDNIKENKIFLKKVSKNILYTSNFDNKIFNDSFEVSNTFNYYSKEILEDKILRKVLNLLFISGSVYHFYPLIKIEYDIKNISKNKEDLFNIMLKMAKIDKKTLEDFFENKFEYYKTKYENIVFYENQFDMRRLQEDNIFKYKKILINMINIAESSEGLIDRKEIIKFFEDRI